MESIADHLRDVPEIAVRLYLGAKGIKDQQSGWDIEFEGRVIPISSEVMIQATKVARVLQIRNRPSGSASDILELRHDAEDIFIEDIMGERKVPRILFVPAGDMASAYYRAMLPADTMMERGLAVSHFTSRLDIYKATRYQILWIQLVTAPILLDIVRQAKSSGVRIVYDIDDRFDALPVANPSSWVYNKEKIAEVWSMIELADLVTTSTQDLADHVRGRAKVVKVLPNLVSASILPKRNEPTGDVFRILWAGSPTHARDLAVASPAIARVLARHAGKVRFTLFGESLPKDLSEVFQYIDQMRFVDFPEYSETLARVGADVAIAPLEDTPFNASKSAVKFLEYSACGYPSLLSSVGEYKELPPESGRVFVPDDFWEQALEEALNMPPDDLQRRGKLSRKWTIENRCLVRTNARQWAETARDLLAESVPSA